MCDQDCAGCSFPPSGAIIAFDRGPQSLNFSLDLHTIRVDRKEEVKYDYSVAVEGKRGIK